MLSVAPIPPAPTIPITADSRKLRCPLDVEVLEIQARRAWQAEAHRHRGAGLRLQEPCLDRPGAGFIRGWSATSASAYDGAQLAGILDRSNTGSRIWTDTAYRSAKNEDWLDRNGYVFHIHRKKPQGRPMSRRTRQANAGAR